MITEFNQLDLNKRYTYADYLTGKFRDQVELIMGYFEQINEPFLRSSLL